jgi:RNA polymerase sigma-70 factor (ECF subfamily)
LPKADITSDSRFERVVLPHLDAAYTLARYLVRDPSEADDVLQEAILRAVQYFHTLRHDTDARAWLLTIVRRQCYTMWGHRGDRMNTVSLDVGADDENLRIELVDPGDSPETLTERSLVRARIIDAVDRLPEHLREVIVLRELQQFSYEEIADITDSPIGTVMSRISRARARLAGSLRELVDPGELS